MAVCFKTCPSASFISASWQAEGRAVGQTAFWALRGGHAQRPQFIALARVILPPILISASQSELQDGLAMSIQSLQILSDSRMRHASASDLQQPAHLSVFLNSEEAWKFTPSVRSMGREAHIMATNPYTVQETSMRISPLIWVVIPIQDFVGKHPRKPRLSFALYV